jgi:predicted HTH domain antitoxin
MTMMITIPVDDSILLSLKAGKEEFIRELLFNNALMLYRQERLSLGKAAQLAGYSRMSFIEELQRRGEPIFDYDDAHTQELSNQAAFVHELLNAQER